MKLAMKVLLKIIISTIILGSYCQAQTNALYINTYIKTLKTEGTTKLNHGPLKVSWGMLNTVNVFFVTSYDTEEECYNNHAVLYDQGEFQAFGFHNTDPSFGKGVISVFFDNLDDDDGNELIVIYEYEGRTYFADGGYAGIKSDYQTRVFKCETNDNENLITEYKAIGELLTVNLSMRMGTMHEEELIGREDSIDKLNDVLGVTYNAKQIKKRIRLLKENGFLSSGL